MQGKTVSRENAFPLIDILLKILITDPTPKTFVENPFKIINCNFITENGLQQLFYC